jgi:hypothetical protein
MPSEPTGIDLARQAFNAARANAREKASQPATRRPTARARRTRGAGREPTSLGTVIDQLAADFGWRKPSAGAQAVIRWAEIAPDLAGLAAPERYDPGTRTLHLRPVTGAAGAHLRFLAPTLPDRINQHVGPGTVTTVRILPPGPAPRHEAGIPRPPAPEPGPVRTRETASPGYHRALTAHQTSKPDHQPRLTPRVAAAIRAQDQALAARRDPEEAFTGARDFVEALRAAADPHRRALARARAEKAGPTVPPTRTA